MNLVGLGVALGGNEMNRRESITKWVGFIMATKTSNNMNLAGRDEKIIVAT
jgi:hypothetical protein